jgi:hypothetical protein
MIAVACRCAFTITTSPDRVALPDFFDRLPHLFKRSHLLAAMKHLLLSRATFTNSRTCSGVTPMGFAINVLARFQCCNRHFRMQIIGGV